MATPTEEERKRQILGAKSPGQAREIPTGNVAPDVTPVHIAGRRGSTVENDELTTGDTTLARLTKSAFTADPRSAAGRSQQAALLEAYYQRHHPAEKSAAESQGDDTEAQALRKSRKRLAKLTRGGEHPARATAKSFERYNELGGKEDFVAWCKKASG